MSATTIPPTLHHHNDSTPVKFKDPISGSHALRDKGRPKYTGPSVNGHFSCFCNYNHICGYQGGLILRGITVAPVPRLGQEVWGVSAIPDCPRTHSVTVVLDSVFL